MSREAELTRTQVVPRSVEETFAFFADPWNLEAITPPWLRFRILETDEPLREGARLRYRLRLYGLPVYWRTEIVDWSPPQGFTDVQRRGPYRLWVHEHRFRAVPAGTEVHDRVRYRIPLGPVGLLAGRLVVRRWLDEIFDYRARRLAELLGS